jgi:hypothetical protein
MSILKSKFVAEVVVKDPDTGNYVEVEIHKHPNGGMFGMDSSYLDQKFGGEEDAIIPDPFNDNENMVGIILTEPI